MPAKKTEYLQIRISTEVKEILSHKAEQLGLSMSEYARHLILADAKQLIDSKESEDCEREGE